MLRQQIRCSYLNRAGRSQVSLICFLTAFNINSPESLFRGLEARALSLIGGLDGLSDMPAEVRQLLQKKTNLMIRKSWRIEPSENKERMKKKKKKKRRGYRVCVVF